VFILTAILLGIHSTLVHRKSRTFHYVTALLAAVGALSYYAMATNSTSPRLLFFGIHDGSDAFHKVATYREVYPARFVGWFVFAPLILLNPLLLSGVSWMDIWTTLVVTELTAVCALMAGVTGRSPCVLPPFSPLFDLMIMQCDVGLVRVYDHLRLLHPLRVLLPWRERSVSYTFHSFLISPN
jgi:hypothetical protein